MTSLVEPSLVPTGQLASFQGLAFSETGAGLRREARGKGEWYSEAICKPHDEVM